MTSKRTIQFTPSIKTEWSGAFDYISDSEKLEIMNAIFNYPYYECDSKFWLKTIKPEFDKQLSDFQDYCESQQRKAEKRWQKKDTVGMPRDTVGMPSNIYNIKQDKIKKGGVGENNQDDNQDENQVEDTDKYTDNNINNKVSNKVLLKKPTLEEVKSYCLERNNTVDPEKWFNYYQSNGWKVGKNSMKDWKASIRTWEKSSFDKPKLSKQEQIEKNTQSVYERAMQKAIEEDIKNGVYNG